MGSESINYEIIYKKIDSQREYMTTNDYKSIDKCKDDLDKYNNNNNEVVGILETKHIERVIPIEECV